MDGLFSHITLTKPGYKKEGDISTEGNAFRENCRTTGGVEAEVIPECDTAILKSLETAKKEKAALLVTGSFYLLAEAKKILSRFREDQGN